MNDLYKSLLASAILLCMIALVYDSLDSQPENANLSVTQPQSESNVVIHLDVVPKLTNASVTDITVHIDEDQSQNVTIWKGNEMVCYIPRS